MALYNHSYSGIITKGLGGPACCNSLTLGFSLFFCKIEVSPPKPPKTVGGGWAAYPVHRIPGVPKGSPYYTPVTKGYGEPQRVVSVSVDVGNKKWEKTYIVGERAADVTVKTINLFNATADNVKVIASGFKRVANKVAVVFKQTDK